MINDIYTRIKRHKHWIHIIFIWYLIHDEEVHSYSLFSSTPAAPSCRRRFLNSVAMIVPMTTNIGESFADSAINLQNYKYSDNWEGTSLEILSAQDAADWKDHFFPFGRWPDPILRRKASLIHFEQIGQKSLERIGFKLRETAREKGAVGLDSIKYISSTLRCTHKQSFVYKAESMLV
jgi:hypothetical protein